MLPLLASLKEFLGESKDARSVLLCAVWSFWCWSEAMEFSRYLKHTHYSSADGRGCAPVDGPVIPSGAEIAYKPITPRRRDSLTSVGSQDAVCFGRYALHAGGDRAGDVAGGCWGRFSDL